ncbi:MAG TPA: AraC family transcriptional regulator [Capsulimonadaceae bacterium]|jgi:AraC-like DNA-binding protein
MYTIDAFQSILLGDTPLSLNGEPHVYRCSPEWRWDVPPLRDFDLWCVLDGVGTFALPSGPLALAAGVCLVIPPGCRPSAVHDPARPLTVFAAHFNATQHGRAPTEILVQAVRDVPFLAALAHRCEQASRSRRATANRECLSLVREVLLLIASERDANGSDAVDEEIADVVDAVRADPSHRWAIEEMAQRAFLSRSQFSRRFERAMGLSPMEFVIAVRLDVACRLLIETRLSVSVIALRLGYENGHYFSRQFHARCGKSPSAFRSAGM